MTNGWERSRSSASEKEFIGSQYRRGGSAVSMRRRGWKNPVTLHPPGVARSAGGHDVVLNNFDGGAGAAVFDEAEGGYRLAP